MGVAQAVAGRVALLRRKRGNESGRKADVKGMRAVESEESSRSQG
jgi:hypothetical protein